MILEEDVADAALGEGNAGAFEDGDFGAFDIEFEELDGLGGGEELIELRGLDGETPGHAVMFEKAAQTAVDGSIRGIEQGGGTGVVGEGDGVEVDRGKVGQGFP